MVFEQNVRSFWRVFQCEGTDQQNLSITLPVMFGCSYGFLQAGIVLFGSSTSTYAPLEF